MEQSLTTLGGVDQEVPKEWRIGRIEKLFAGRKYRDVLKDLQLFFESEPAARSQTSVSALAGSLSVWNGPVLCCDSNAETPAQRTSEIAAQAMFTVAECYRKLDNYSQFKQTAEEMEADLAKSHWWEEALFSLGNYNLVRRDLDESLTFYQKIVERFPNGTRVKDSHWRVAWYTYRGGEIERALELFVDHLYRFPDSEHRTAALYWVGRAQLKLGNPLEARQLFQAIAQRFPTQYYGQLARAQLTAGSDQARVAYRPNSKLEKVLADLKSSTRTPASVDLTPIRNDALDDWPRVKTLAHVQLFESGCTGTPVPARLSLLPEHSTFRSPGC